VADFYLPHLIHNVKTVQQPIDACEELREVKMIDFTVISKALSKEVNIGKPNASFKTFFNAKAKQ
jgi:hypothetical protein